MNDADHDPDGRVALEALSATLADPQRLVDELLAAEDDGTPGGGWARRSG